MIEKEIVGPVWIDSASLWVHGDLTFLARSPAEDGGFEITLDYDDMEKVIWEWRSREGEFVMVSGHLAEAVDGIVNGLPEASPNELVEWAEFFEAQARKLREAALVSE